MLRSGCGSLRHSCLVRRIVASVKLNVDFMYKMGVLSGYRSIMRLVGSRFDDLLLVTCPWYKGRIPLRREVAFAPENGSVMLYRDIFVT
jgi:hypothetical protein